MIAACAVFDAFDYVKRLEVAGVTTKAAEAHVQLQIDLQKQLLKRQEHVHEELLEKFEEYRPMMDELKIIKDELVTKSDLKYEIGSLRAEMHAEMKNLRFEMHSEMKNLRNELIIKLGGIVVASTAVLCSLMVFLLNHSN